MTSFSTILISTTSIALLAFVVIYAWQQRSQTAAPQLMVTTLFMFIWASGSFAEMLASGDSNMILCRNITQIGVFYAPAACLMFAMAYSGLSARLRKRLGIGIYALQTVSVALIFADPLLHLMRVSVSVVESGGFHVVVVESTTLAGILISVNFILLAVSLILLVVFAVRTRNRMRRQVLLPAAGMAIVFAFAFVKVASGEHFASGMPISGVFGIICLAMLLGIIRYDFLKILPVARSEVLGIIEEGIVIASPRGEVLDANKAAARFFSRGLPEPLQCDEKGLAAIDTLLREQYPQWHDSLASCQAQCLELSQTACGEVGHYQCSTYLLDDKRKRTLGTISVLRDVTRQKRQNDLLKIRAERDGLLGIYNRQTFFELAGRELSQSDSENSLVFFDIDDFKNVNDSFGHIAGDHALRGVCACIQRIIGTDAMFGRIGGEEFAVFFRSPGFGAQLPYRRAHARSRRAGASLLPRPAACGDDQHRRRFRPRMFPAAAIPTRRPNAVSGQGTGQEPHRVIESSDIRWLHGESQDRHTLQPVFA